MKISVITVCFNAERTIADTLRSVASQDYDDLEHIVIDGGSVDNSVELIKLEGRRVSNFVSEPDRGVYDAMNKGLQIASGEVIGFLNADDVYSNSSVVARIAQVFQDPSVEACYADLLYVKPDDLSRVVRYWKSRSYQKGLFQRGWMPAHPTFYVRKSVFERFGGFDLAFKRQADFDLTLRFLEIHHIRSVYVPEIWVKMRIGGLSNNSLIGIIKGNLEAYSICKKNMIKVYPWFIPLKLISRLPQFFIRPTSKNL